MSLSLITLRFVAAHDSQLAVVRSALPLAFPERSTHTERAASLADAQGRASGGDEILVLNGGSPEDVASALETHDQRGLPRWAVVRLGEGTGHLGVESLGKDELEPRVVARALRSSLDQLAWRRRWARERGDVWTIGRRLTHDLRNPLGCIVTTSEMLKEMLETDAPDHVAFVEPITESTAEMLDLINRLHFVAKASAQPQPPEILDMEAAHQAAIDRLTREITRRGAHLSAPEEWPEVRGVRTWLETIWWNLINNAMRHGGEPAKIQTGWARDDRSWLFWVEDEGPGVAAERVPNLFTPFDQLHKRHGGGIGLSIVQRLVELHGGRCAYESRPEGGARFTFSLPLHELTRSDKDAAGHSGASHTAAKGNFALSSPAV